MRDLRDFRDLRDSRDFRDHRDPMYDRYRDMRDSREPMYRYTLSHLLGFLLGFFGNSLGCSAELIESSVRAVTLSALCLQCLASGRCATQ